MTAPHDLTRFVAAQDPVWPAVLAELAAGRKRTHWMWFVFPQLAGLGSSPMARHYALASLTEARAYVAHPLLGPRLAQASDLLLGIVGRSAHDIFGAPDDLKFRSCMTLFAHAAPERPHFAAALARHFDGRPDPRTLDLLGLARTKALPEPPV